MSWRTFALASMNHLFRPNSLKTASMGKIATPGCLKGMRCADRVERRTDRWWLVSRLSMADPLPIEVYDYVSSITVMLLLIWRGYLVAHHSSMYMRVE